MSLIIACTGLFAITAGYAFITTTQAATDAFINGHYYQAKVVDHTVQETEEGTFYWSVLEVTSTNGAKNRIDAIAGTWSPDEIGSTFHVFFNSNTNNSLILSFETALAIGCFLLLVMLLVIPFIALLSFLLGMSLVWFKNYLSAILLPFILIAFDALLICAFFKNILSFIVIPLLVLFIVPFSLMIYWYIKTLIQDGPPEWDFDFE